MNKKRSGHEPTLRARIVSLLKKQPLLSFTDAAEVVETSKQYVQLVADSTPGLRDERTNLKNELLAKLKKRPMGYIPVSEDHQ